MQGHAPDRSLSSPPYNGPTYQSPGISRQLPGQTQRDLGAAPEPPKPVQAKGREALLDELFTRLHDAAEPEEAQGIASAIQRIWLRSGSDTADLLMARALSALSAHNTELCLSVLDKVIELNPDWAEGWNKRATIRYVSADYAGAMADIAHVLALEPRHFGALAGMGYIFQKLERDKQALSVFRKVLEIYPQQEDIRKTIEKLSPDVDGRDI